MTAPKPQDGRTPAGRPPVLEVRSLSKRFYGLRVLREVSLQVQPGEVVGLIGPNGSGKTTLFDCITGLQRPDGGRVYLSGREVTGWPMHRLSRSGLARTFQQARAYSQLTVWDNLLLAAQAHRPAGVLAELLDLPAARRLDGELGERARAALDFVGLQDKAAVPAGQLSYGQRKLLQLAAALMADPEIFLLDEPTAAVNPVMVEAIKGRIAELNAGGRAFLIIEHNMGVVMGLCHRVYALAAGEVIAHGRPEEVRHHEAVVAAYFGR